MRQLSIERRGLIISIALLALAGGALPGGVAPATPARAAVASSCAALGTYLIGPRVLPYTARRVTPPSARAAVAARLDVAVPGSVLLGSLTLSGYTSCGTPTAGSFSVHRAVVGPVQPNRQSTIACLESQPCMQSGYGVISATGTFRQDPLHADTPLYVRVDAKLVVARLAPQLGQPCSNNAGGCPLPRVITSTVTMSDVTGYLQVSPSGTTGAAPLSAQRGVTLSFLPPPSANTDAAPAALVLVGWRTGRPQPAPAP